VLVKRQRWAILNESLSHESKTQADFVTSLSFFVPRRALEDKD